MFGGEKLTFKLSLTCPINNIIYGLFGIFLVNVAKMKRNNRRWLFILYFNFTFDRDNWIALNNIIKKKKEVKYSYYIGESNKHSVLGKITQLLLCKHQSVKWKILKKLGGHELFDYSIIADKH